MLKVTWPWYTRSRLIVTVWNYIYLTSATIKTCKTKKDHRSSVTRTRDRKGHAQGHVTLIYRSRLIVTVWNYIYLTSATIKTCKTKKDHRSSVTRTRDRKGHAQDPVTLTYKVTLDSYSVELYLFDICDPKNLQNKKKIIALASLEPEIKKVTFRVTWPWRTRLKATVCIYVHLTPISKITSKIAQKSSL